MFKIFLIFFCLMTLPQLYAAERIKIVATNYPLAFLAQEIVGTMADVEQLIPMGVEPHDYRPTPKKIKSLFSANYVLFNGEMMEPWVKKLSAELQRNNIILLEVGPLFPLEKKNNGDIGHDHHKHAYQGHGNVDPHFWLDPLKLKLLAQQFAASLSVYSGLDHGKIKENLHLLQGKLDQLHEDWKQGLLNCKGQDILVDHDAFGHLANRYHFTAHSIRGLSPSSRPGPKKLVELIKLIQKYQLKFIFYEDLVSPKYSKLLAEQAAVGILILHPIGSLTKLQQTENKDYFNLMEENLNNIQKALSCK